MGMGMGMGMSCPPWRDEYPSGLWPLALTMDGSGFFTLSQCETAWKIRYESWHPIHADVNWLQYAHAWSG